MVQSGWGQNLAQEKGEKKAGKQCWGWVCGIIERPYNLGLRSVDIFSGERETLWKSLGGW